MGAALAPRSKTFKRLLPSAERELAVMRVIEAVYAFGAAGRAIEIADR